jgi:type II secretory pathway component PulF
MFGGLIGWVLIGITVVVILIIGGVVLPIVVPMMTGFTDASQDTIATGTPFLQLLANWWPLFLPIIIVFAIVVLVMVKGKSTGGGGV